MDETAISKFKATCLAVLERVRKMRKPIRVTKFGEPIAEVVPPSPKPKKTPWLGSMAGTGRIMGDILSPAIHENDWEVLTSENSSGHPYLDLEFVTARQNSGPRPETS